MRAALARRLLRTALPAAAALATGGCTLLSPMPSIELAKATAGMATVAIGQGPVHATQTVFHGEALPPRVCIEYNRALALPEFVPALIAELREHEVQARVFEPGVRPGDEACPAWVHYQGLQQWDRPPLSEQIRPYLAQATLSLHDAGGRLMAASSYRADDATLGLGKWASTRNKLAPVVRALLTGFEG
ncbi:cell division protein FtsI [Mitsuaria sp. GD03876]|uniref:cell division protein FtsI n=1 Tax=Mitsuaria sp. GD03876 TaxID=2975399 RepID=UPI00244BCAFB|nr:cell division protein FtsI [Mitsuaria sp. GD03876]MDH0865249.1 cell division protein FtsI [Mitsuaria sp. GD03876]